MSASLYAEDSKYAGESFSIGVGARGLAMGSAFHTLATGAEALWWNPAGLARTGTDKLNNMAFMHSERFGGEVDYNFLGYSRKTNFGDKETVFGAGIIHLGVGSIPITTSLEDPDSPLGNDNRPVIDKYGSKNDIAVVLGAARKFKDKYYVGANVKILMVRQEGGSANGFGFDFGVTMPWEFKGIGLLASVSARDITTSFLAWDTGKREYIRPWISAGLALKDGIKVPGGMLGAAFEVSIPVESRAKNYDSNTDYALSLLHLGAEYAIDNRFFIRGGVDENHPAFGAGIAISSLSLDYAWVGHKDLDQTHRASISLSF